MKKTKVLKIKRTEERNLPCKHSFIASERLEIGDKLAAIMQTYGEVEDQMKVMVSDFKNRLKAIAVDRDQFAARIRDGYEMRDIRCLVTFNTATDAKGKPVKKQGMKRITNASTKEFIRDEPMSPSDLQAEMFAEDKLKAESKAAKARKSPNVSGERKSDALNSPEIPENGEVTSTAATA